MSLACDPIDLTFPFEDLVVMALTGMSNGIDAMSKDLRVAVVGGGGGWYGVAVGHKKISTTNNLVIG